MQLFKSFPNMGVVMDITINKHDEIHIDPNGVHLTLLGDLLFKVIQPDDTIVDAFSIKTVMTSWHSMLSCFVMCDTFSADSSVYLTS